MRTAFLAIALCALSSVASAANLLLNGTFDHDVSNWVVYPNTCALEWLAFNSLHQTSSGSLQMTMTSEADEGYFISQCVAVRPDFSYDLGARIMVPAGQPLTRGIASLQFYETADCSNRVGDGAFAPFVTTPANGLFVPVAARNNRAPHVAHGAKVAIGMINIDSGTTTAYFDDVVLALAGGCVPDSTTLCVNDGRFEVRGTYRVAGEAPEDARVVQLTPDSGYMWFFNRENVEVTVKVLNGCTINRRYWVFAAGMTNVEVSVVVTDTLTGVKKVYQSPLNTPFVAIQDTDAFSCN